MFLHSEAEKIRRWQEIKIRQHRLLAEVNQSHPAHIEQIMKSGFTMSDIKGWFLSASCSTKLLFRTPMKCDKMLSKDKRFNFMFLLGDKRIQYVNNYNMWAAYTIWRVVWVLALHLCFLYACRNHLTLNMF